jgi:enoyl-CoA hydratase
VVNAIDDAVCDELEGHVAALEADGAVSVIVLSGAGDKAFSSGADIKFMRQLSGAPLRRFIERTWEVFERLARSPLVSIAALHGYVLGGGVELALACDLRIADASATLGFPEMTLGSVPGSGALQRLPALIGPARTMELVTLGRRIGADEALAMGLVNRVVPEGQALAAAMELAAEIAKRPAESLRYAKIALGLGRGGGVAAAFHGLVSSARQADPAYRRETEKFARRTTTESGER